jgi:hypothetical protein
MDVSKFGKGLKHPERVLQHLAKKPFIFIDKHCNYGTSIFEREWDLLIILDACRYDLFVEFGPQHRVFERFSSVERMYSVGSQSEDWIERTFESAEGSRLAQTTYISDDGHVDMMNESGLHDIVSIELTEDNSIGGVIRPEVITEEALRQFRSPGASKFIVHYTQPHAPFLHCVGKYDSTAEGSGGSQNVWTGIRDGEFEKDEVWRDYGRNLLLVLDHVETMIENFEGKIVVTADHGNAMGEFGLYGHPGREAAPSIRAVPWAVANGSGNEERGNKG